MTWDEFCNKAKKTVSKAADKINQTADLATLQVKLSMSERKLEEEYAALGKVAYKHFTEENSSADEVAKAMEAVRAAQIVIDDYKKQIADLQKRNADGNKSSEN